MLAVVSDKKLYNPSSGTYSAQVVSAKDYFPFGFEMPGRSFSAGVYRYGFNGQEKDIEWLDGQAINYKYRVYDTRIARFFAVDPISSTYPHLTPYQVASLSPIYKFELEGLEGVEIHVASFAPFDQFGGPFEGDGNDRRFGTNPQASVRIRGSVSLYLDVHNKTAEILGTTQGGSISEAFGMTTISEGYFRVRDLAWRSRILDEYGDPIEAESLVAKKEMSIQLFGNNDLMTELSPDIDIEGMLFVSAIPTENGSIMNVYGGLYGDAFPASEMFLIDKFGKAVMLGVSGADGNPVTSLPSRNDRPMTFYNVYIHFDSDGAIRGVSNQQNGAVFNVEVWNSFFENLDPQSSEVSTNTETILGE